MCNNFCQLLSFMLKYGNFENRPISRKDPSVQRKAQFRPHGVEREHMSVRFELLPMARVYVQIWQV